MINKVIVYFSFVLLSCGNSSDKQYLKANVDKWNTGTYDFFHNQCQTKFDSIRLGDESIKVEYQKKKLETYQDYFKFCFKNRNFLIDYINDSITVKNNLRIFENYTLHKNIKYFIQVDERETVSFEIDNNKLIKKKKNRIDQIDRIFQPIDSTSCFSNFNSLPQKMFIISDYYPTKDFKVYQVSLFD